MGQISANSVCMDFTFIIPSVLLVLNIKRLDEGAVAGLLLLLSRKRKSEKGQHQLLILSTTDICKLLIKKNLSVSVTLTSLRLQSQATYQLSIISMGPAPD